MLYLKCEGQVVKIVEDERLADKYINANIVHFDFCERWADMIITAQFTQERVVLNQETQKQEKETNTFNVLVDEITHTVTMPNEIVAGDVYISAFGEHPETGVRITSIPVKKTVDKSGFVGDGATPIPPTPDLYSQLIAKVDAAEENEAEHIKNAVDQYLAENPVQTGATKEQADQIEANRQAIENYVPPVTSVNGMTGDVVIDVGGTADSIEWNKVTDKPITFPPDPHTHSYNELANKPEIPVVPNFLPNPYALTINGQSYNGSEPVNVTVSGGGGAADSVAWENVTGKPTAYPPEGHTHSLSSLGALGKNETAANSAKLGGKAPEYYIQTRNLLDNSDFRNPVNQRGFTSVGYTGEETYCIDRWLASCIDSTGSISLTENGLVCVNAYIVQRIPIKRLDENKKYTLAIKYEGKDVSTNVSPWIEFNYGNGAHHRLIIYGINDTVEHIALYEGEYTAETLPPYIRKGYAAELAECRRYYQKITSYTGLIATYMYNAYVRGYIHFDPMRVAVPRVSVGGQMEYLPPGGEWASFVPDLIISGDSVAITNSAAQSSTPGYSCMIRAEIILEADLQ